MGQGACVQPLSEVFKICGIALGEGEGGGNRFTEAVGGIEGGGEEGGDGAESFKVEVEGVVGTADRDGNGCLEELSVVVQCAIKVSAGELYLVGVDGVGSTRVLGMVEVTPLVVIICFFFLGIPSSEVIPGILGTILVDSRSRRVLLDKEIIVAGATR